MTSIDKLLIHIDQCISIKDEDRKPYTAMFDEVRDWLLDSMKSVSPVFRQLFAGYVLFGSYSNGVRLVLPKEFDILFALKFPFPVPITFDINRRGCLQLPIQRNIENLKTNINQSAIYNECITLCENGYFSRPKFQKWIANIIEKAIDQKAGLVPQKYKISFEKHAVAQNIYVQDIQNNRKISIDFVAAISLTGCNSIRRRISVSDEYYKHFYAVPKATAEKYPIDTYDYTFSIVNVIAERDLLWDKQNLKVVYRLLKSLRDHYEMKRLKSGFLTHMFLMEVERRPAEYWKKSVFEIFCDMLQVLCGVFVNGNLPYYWVPEVNLLGILNDEEITSFRHTLAQVNQEFMSLIYISVIPFEKVSKHFDMPK